MSTLNVSALKNIGAGFTNLLLNSDGSVTLPVYTNASTPPVQFQAGTLWFNGTNLQIRNSANTAWVAVGGGGGGTVTGVTASLPLVSSGGAAPNLTINAATAGALGAVQIGTNLQVTGGGTISILDASDTQKGVVEMATAAEAAAGASATLAAPVAYSVPKDAANMTGAAILPSGTDLQRAAITGLTAGMTRFNTDYTPDSLEVYDGANWKQVAYANQPTSLGDLTPTNGSTLPSAGVYDNITINAGVTVNATGVVYLRALNSITVNGTINGVGQGPKGGYSNSLQTIPAGGSIQTVAGLGAGIAPGVAGLTTPVPSTSFTVLNSSSGGPGSTNVGQSSGATSQGGAGGASLVLVCEGPITVGASASILMSGGNAPAVTVGGGSASAVGGGGGGSGGLIYLESSSSLTLSAGSSLTAAGGNGANGSGTGGFAGGGGGGGGGGYIVLNSPSLSDSSTKTLTGGSAGAGTNSNGPGGSGAAFGGFGGQVGATGGTSSSGGVGQTLTNVYLF